MRPNDDEDEFLSLDEMATGGTRIEPPDPATTTVVGLSVASLPTPYVKSERHPCSVCGQPIWLATQDRALARLIAAGSRTMCRECANADGFGDARMVTTRATLERAALVKATIVGLDA